MAVVRGVRVRAGGPLLVNGAVAVGAVVRQLRIGGRIDPGIVFVVRGGHADEINGRRLLVGGDAADEVAFFPGRQSTALRSRLRQAKEPVLVGKRFGCRALPANAGGLHRRVALTHLARKCGGGSRGGGRRPAAQQDTRPPPAAHRPPPPAGPRAAPRPPCRPSQSRHFLAAAARSASPALASGPRSVPLFSLTSA